VYNNFFGFKERPFQLVPNPAYLFLSRSHEEAMAHLKYAISHGDGFVEISGEVGTGKTTLCRAFLDGLGEDTEVAYIFNPRLDSLELLRAVNTEFGIDSTSNNAKDLIDALNAFLIEKKSQNKTVILLIDEAQNLDKEVLEQLRLLSNLETNTSKLLQIILVGQPELQKLLDSYELRQLRQRITLSWYLTPLNREETREYIRHRVNIASQKTEDKFSMGAYREIYKYSKGIPRLINIACDRSLLTAFGFNRPKVTGRIARSSIREIKARGGNLDSIFTGNRVFAAVVALFCLAFIAALVFKWPPLFKSHNMRAETKKESKNTVSAGEKGNNRTLDTKKILAFEYLLENLSNRSSRFTAMENIFSLWEITPNLKGDLDSIDNDGAFFQLAAAQNNFTILLVNKDLDLVQKLNLPAVLEFLPPGAISPRYLTLVKITNNEMTFKGGEQNETIRVKPGKMKLYWTGSAYIPWRNFYNTMGDIPNNAPKESILTLKMLLRDMGFKEMKLDYRYDNPTREIVKGIQEKYGIEVDGIVGAKTKIIIYNEKKDLKIPHIVSLNGTGIDANE